MQVMVVQMRMGRRDNMVRHDRNMMLHRINMDCVHVSMVTMMTVVTVEAVKINVGMVTVVTGASQKESGTDAGVHATCHKRGDGQFSQHTRRDVHGAYCCQHRET